MNRKFIVGILAAVVVGIIPATASASSTNLCVSSSQLVSVTTPLTLGGCLSEYTLTAFGEEGPVGPTGATGATGATGPEGKEGPKGTTGSTGAEGKEGKQGKEGFEGYEVTATKSESTSSITKVGEKYNVKGTCPGEKKVISIEGEGPTVVKAPEMAVDGTNISGSKDEKWEITFIVTEAGTVAREMTGSAVCAL